MGEDYSFQLTLLMRGATRVLKCICDDLLVSTHAPHARSDAYAEDEVLATDVSTHAPHARSDFDS